MPLIHERTFRVRHYECDTYGYVKHANYLNYMQEAAFDASAAAGYSMARYATMDRYWLVRETDIEYLHPLRYGDSVQVRTWVREGNKERIQSFEGVVIKRRAGGLNETFTVRKVSNGVGVERIFPLHSPIIESIKLLRRGRVRRAKLYYLRKLTGKAAKIRERKV